MSAFDRSGALARLRLLAALGTSIALAVAGCDDPMQPRVAPDVTELTLFMLLDPTLGTQPIIVQQGSAQSQVSMRGTVRTATGLIAEDAVDDTSSPYPNMTACNNRYLVIMFPEFWSSRCMTFSFKPQPGETYDVTVTANGRPTAQATTAVPGNFAIVSHKIHGNPPGTVRVQATWTKSAGVHRYVVALSGMPNDMPSCFPEILCHPRWFAVTEDTTIDAVVDAKHFESSAGPYSVTVHAMNRELYGYLMTGATSEYFPVPPAQNVRGGYGAVGAWVKRGRLTFDSVSVQRVADGVRLANESGVEVRYVLWDGNTGPGYSTYCSRAGTSCSVLPAGASTTVPNDSISGLSSDTRFLMFRFWRPNEGDNDAHMAPLYY
jgi:hypothetical protein